MANDFAIVALGELKRHLGVAGTDQDVALEELAQRVSDELEAHLGRRIVDRGSELVELHSFRSDGDPVVSSELLTLDRPIVSVTSVHEDTGAPPTYGASSLLVEGTDYQVVKSRGLLRRVSYGVPIPWATNVRAVRVAYRAGYAQSAVPGVLRTIALRYCGLAWAERGRNAFGASAQSDALGNWTRFSVAMLTPDMVAALRNERRKRAWESGERDE